MASGINNQRRMIKIKSPKKKLSNKFVKYQNIISLGLGRPSRNARAPRMEAVSSPAGKPDARDCTGLCGLNFLEGLAEIISCGTVRKLPKQAAVDPACSQAHETHDTDRGTDSGKAIAEEGKRLGAAHQIHLETCALEPSSSVHVERMSSTSAATDFDSSSSPARLTSSRPKREHTHKLGGDGSDKGYGSSGDEVEQGEKRRRFVWTAELHRRFENVVHQLGLASAKPQARAMPPRASTSSRTGKSTGPPVVAPRCTPPHLGPTPPWSPPFPPFCVRVVLHPLNSPSHAAI